MSSISSEIMSLYIPYIPNDWEQESIKQLFSDLNIGIVDRVDFINTGKWDWASSAFVHMAEWFDTSYAWDLYDAIEAEDGQWCINIPGQGRQYFILKKMTCPKIPNTKQNIHQIAAKVYEIETRLVQRVAELEQQLAELLREDFIDQYDDAGPITMDELVQQTEKYDLNEFRSDGKKRTMWYNSEGFLEFDDDDCESDRDYDELFEVNPVRQSKIPLADRLENSAWLCGNN